MKGERTAANRVLYSGVIRNLTKHDGHVFTVSDRQQMAIVRATQDNLRNGEVKTDPRQAESAQRDDLNVRSKRDFPRP
ncbi:hypothetical protein [Serratia symbiotica]|uniref:hypothetical protein n=1 Tax=Serratia symbiotica TaxID=138074 RepID=UPI001E504CDA|nr:hypothetical protein [Serratia symbiotica]